MKRTICRVVVIVLYILFIFLLAIFFDECVSHAYEYKFTESQQKTADRIAEVLIDEWETYGVLPSIGIAQAYIESQIGDNGIDNFNYWGLGGQLFFKYWTLDDGIYAYMQYINNGHYTNAPFEKDWRKQIRYILDGNYCVPEGDYQWKVEWCYRQFNLEEYDKKLFKSLREKKWNKTYTIAYNPTIPSNQIQVDKSIIKSGSICVYGKEDKCMKGIYDVVTGQNGYVLSTSNLSLVGKKVKIKVYEDAKG